jgi:hypothetical protein
MDGSNTKAYFNKLVSYAEHLDAMIAATCDINQLYITKMRTLPDTFFCLLHNAQQKQFERNPYIYNNSCFLTPMYPASQCNFLATDLPKFPKEEIATPSSEVSICAHGANRNYALVAKVFSQIPYREYNATFVIGQRNSAEKTRRAFMEAGILDNTKFVTELDYVKFHKLFATCDIFMLLIEPLESPAYFDFPLGVKKSSGFTPAIIAYKIPAIVHEAFAAIYGDYFTAPVEVYDNTFESKRDVLTRLLIKVHDEKKFTAEK